MIKKIITSFKRTFSRFSKLILWMFSLCLLLALIIQIGVVGAVFWINSQNGQDFIKDQIDIAAEESGYDISFTRISYAFPQGVRIRALSVKDQNHKIMDLNDLIIRPDVIGFGIKRLGLAIEADELIVYQLPASPKPENIEDKPFYLEPFSLPDLYFESFAIDRLKVKTLDIREDVFGTALKFSPSLESRVSLGDIIHLDLQLTRDGDQIDLAWMPRTVTLKGSLDPKSLEMILDSTALENEHYKASAKGHIFLSENGVIDVLAHVQSDDLKAFTSDYQGKINIETKIAGTLNTPSIKADGFLESPLLKEKGLGNVSFELSDDNLNVAPLGHAYIKSTYLDKPVSVSGDFDLVENIVKLTAIKGSAPDLILNGNADINTDTFLIDGKFDLKADNLKTYSTLIGQEISGKAKADMILSDGNGQQNVSVETVLNDLSYDKMTIQQSVLNTKIENIQNPWPNEVNATFKNFKPAPDVIFSKGEITLSAQQNDLYDLILNAQGHAMQDFAIDGKATVSGIQSQNISAQNIDVKIMSKGSAININGKADQKTIDMNLQTRKFDLASLPVTLPEQLRNVSLSGNARIQGSLAGPIINAQADLSPIDVVSGSRIIISANGDYKDDVAIVHINGKGDAIENLQGEARVPLKLSLLPFEFDMPQTTPLNGQLNARAEASALAPLFLPSGHTLRGALTVNGQLEGTLQNPDISGTAEFKNGHYRFNAYGATLHDIDLSAALDRDGAIIQNLKAKDGYKGTLNGAGNISFLNPIDTNIDIKLNDFHLFESDKAKGTLSADLDLKGQDAGYLIRGDINLGQFDIIIPERFKSNIPELNIVEKDEKQSEKEKLRIINLDIKVLADNRIFVRGWGLDAEFGGQVNVDGALSDPQLNGSFSSRRGRYEEFGKRFDLERAYLRFQGSSPPSPYLDIMATTDADEIKASVNLAGEIGNPKIKLSSVPALPQDEVMSHILFGKNLQKITPFQAIQLKQTLDRLTGRGGNGFDPLGKLRDLTGLDDLRVEQDDEGEASVGVGKYLSEDVYLELEKGAGEDSGTANVEVELTPSITLESEVGQNAQAGAGVFWKWDY